MRLSSERRVRKTQMGLPGGRSESPLPVVEPGNLPVVDECNHRGRGKGKIDPPVSAILRIEGQAHEENEDEVEQFQSRGSFMACTADRRNARGLSHEARSEAIRNSTR